MIAGYLLSSGLYPMNRSAGSWRPITVPWNTWIKNVGLVLGVLRELELDQTTLIVYLGDHGYQLGHHGRFEKTHDVGGICPGTARDSGSTTAASNDPSLSRNTRCDSHDFGSSRGPSDAHRSGSELGAFDGW